MVFLLLACSEPGPGKPSDSEPQPPSGPVIELFYMASDVAGDAGEDTDPHNIYRASSTDGVTFTEQAMVFTTAMANDPDVFQLDAGFGLFVSTGPSLTFASSAVVTGSFTFQSDVPWFGGGGSSTVLVSGLRRTFFCGDDGIYASTFVLNPIGFEPFELALANPFPTGRICDPSVIGLGDGTYRMYYRWSPELEAPTSDHSLYQATSTDGLRFTAVEEVIVASASVPGAVVRDATVFLYAVNGRPPDEYDTGDTAPPDLPPGEVGLLVGTSTDGGQSFAFEPLVLEGGERRRAFDPIPMFVD